MQPKQAFHVCFNGYGTHLPRAIFVNTSCIFNKSNCNADAWNLKQGLLWGGVFFRLIVTETACCKYVRGDTVVEHQQALSSLASHPPSVGSIWTFPVEPSIYLRPWLIPHHLPKIHKRYPTMRYPVSGFIAYAMSIHIWHIYSECNGASFFGGTPVGGEQRIFQDIDTIQVSPHRPGELDGGTREFVCPRKFVSSPRKKWVVGRRFFPMGWR